MTVTETLVASRYRIGRCLGTGGMGRVWLARDEVLRRDVAIKEIALPFGLADDEREDMRDRTLREARAAARLSHPNVVRIYDVQPGDERPWIVMEYVPSRSLLQVIKENGPLPPAEVAGIGLAVLAALDAAQRAGVMHRDIKPSNVLIADDGRVVLTDFGAAVMDEGEGALTQTGVILGSPRYIAPERAATGISTIESDLWSLGATLYEAVEGRAPYTRETTMAMLVALATEKPDPVQHAGPLKPVINGLLQKNPRSRMRLPEVEQRLRRIADVQNAVRLHHVPAPRADHEALADAPWRSPIPLPAVPEQPVRRSTVVSRPVKVPGPPPSWPPGSPVPAAAPAPSEEAAAPAPSEDADASLPVPVAAPSAPEPADPRRARRPRLVAAVLVTAAVIGGAVTYGVNDGSPLRSGNKPITTSGAAGLSGIPSAAAPTSAVTPTAPSTALPAGYRWYDSKSGFHVAWPASWVKIQETRTSVTLCAPGGPPVVAVREWTPPDPDLATAMRREETAAGLRKYKRLGMTVAPRQDSAEWEYTFTDPRMGDLHGLERAVVHAGRTYLIQWRTPAAKWAENKARLDVVLRTFRPAPPPAVRPGAAPAGFTQYRSVSDAFSVVTPVKWAKIGETRTSVVFCAPGGPPVVTVRQWAPSNVDPGVALAREEELANLPRYRRISMETLPGQRGAVWEYTFTDPKEGRMHGLERAFMTVNGAYLIQWRTPADEWTANLSKLGTITQSFRPAP